MSNEIDGDQLINGAQSMIRADGPYDCLTNAHQALQAAELGHMAFGPVGGIFVSSGYTDARTTHVENLDAGVQKFEAMIEGLNTVAENYDAAESANIIDGERDGSDVTRVQPGDGGRTGTQTAMLSVLVVLAAENAAIAAMLGVASTMAPAALAAVAGWAAFSPNDEELSNAGSLWEAAYQQLAAYPTLINAGRNQVNEAWSGDDKVTYDEFMDEFATEVDQTATAVQQCKTALTDATSALQNTQAAFFLQAAAALAAIIAAQALVALPFIGPAFEAIKHALGGVLAVTTLGTVGYIATILSQSSSTLQSLAGQTFTGDTPNVGSQGTGFDDITIDLNWDSIQPS